MLDVLNFDFGDGRISEPVLKPLLLEMLADDHEDAFSLLIRLPLLVRDDAHEHANTVENVFHG